MRLGAEQTGQAGDITTQISLQDIMDRLQSRVAGMGQMTGLAGSERNMRQTETHSPGLTEYMTAGAELGSSASGFKLPKK
jgi:hypothetical protein